MSLRFQGRLVVVNDEKQIQKRLIQIKELSSLDSKRSII